MALDLDQIRQLLIENGYKDYDLSDDSVIMDLLGKAFLILAKPLEEQINFVRNAQSIENYATMEEWQMDQLIANVFIKRREGSRSKTTVRMYFTSPQNVEVKSDYNYFYTKEGLKFYPQDNYSFIKENFKVVEINGFKYYAVDIPVVAEGDGDPYNINAGEIRHTNFKNSFFSFVENLSDASGGILQQDNEQVSTSARRAITVRDNVTKDAIYTVFTQRFNQILDLESIGYLDPEMHRDITRLSSCWYGHMGAAVDVYVKTPLTYYDDMIRCLPADYKDPDGVEYKVPGIDFMSFVEWDDNEENFVASDENEFMADLEEGVVKVLSRNLVWYNYKWQKYSDVLETVGSEYNHKFYFRSPVVYGLKMIVGGEECPIIAKKIYHKHNAYSIREAVDYYIKLPDGVVYDPLDPLEVQVQYWTNVDDLEQFQDAILEPTMRPIVADILFKNFIPIIIDKVELTYDGSTLTYAEIDKILMDFMYYRTTKKELYVSELIKKISESTILPEIGYRDPDAIDNDVILTSPLKVEYRQFHIDGTISSTVSTNLIGPDENNFLSSTVRTVSLYPNKGYLKLSEK